eukprot:COSAG04_NODE_1890_length_5298_cov_7.441239_2_plen_625_part_00
MRISAASAGTTLGSGALTVSRDSEVTLSHLTVSNSITVQAGSLLTLEEVRFGAAGCVTTEDETSQVVRLGSTPEPPTCVECALEIVNCVQTRCVTSTVAVCDLCEEGYYFYRQDDEPAHCKRSTVTLQQAGFIPDAVGSFEFRFSGSVPSDLTSGEVTVPTTASLSLTGTGAETIGASFTVQGSLSLANFGSTSGDLTVEGSLNVANMRLDAAAISVSGGSASLSGCSGSLTALTARDSPLDIDASTSLTFGPSRDSRFRSIDLRNAGNVTLTGASFEDASVSVGGDRHGGAQLSLVGCQGTLTELAFEFVSANIDTATSESLVLGTVSLWSAGPVALTGTTIENGISVTYDTQLSLSGCTLGERWARVRKPGATYPNTADWATLDIGYSGSLSLASMDVPLALLVAAEYTRVLDYTTDQNIRQPSALSLDNVNVPELAAIGRLSGTLTRRGDSAYFDPPDTFFGHITTGTFTVTAGPCTVSDGGRCVGRPRGYRPNEQCAIAVGGGGGVLGPCPIFDLDSQSGKDYVTLPGEEWPGHGGSDCPVGVALAPGDAIAWTSDGSIQGSVGCNGCAKWVNQYCTGSTDCCYGCNGCAQPPSGRPGMGTCGEPLSQDGEGGGWKLCFA